MSDTRLARDDRPYRPGTWAKVSTLVAGAGWFLQLYFAAMRGADLAQGAFLNVFAAFLLVVIPWVVGTICYMIGRGSQRAGDIAFSAIMVAQGVALAAVGAMAR